MGWTKLDTAIDRIRNMLGEDPGKASQSIAELLDCTRSPSARVRLWGLMVLACCRLEDFLAARRASEEGRKLGGAPLAQAELEWQTAELYIYLRDADAARSSVEKALALLRPLLEPRGSSPGSRRKLRHVHGTYAATLIIRAEIACHLEGRSSLQGAFEDVVEAFRWADPRHASRIHVSAVSALAYLLTQPGVGSLEDVSTALCLAIDADRLLRRRRVAARHPHRLKLRWIRALALARLGAVDLAEHLLATVVKGLRAEGLERDAEHAAEQLVWIVAERAGKLGRASHLRRSLGLSAAEPPAAPPEPPAPIGW